MYRALSVFVKQVVRRFHAASLMSGGADSGFLMRPYGAIGMRPYGAIGLRV